jgi:hypothetical protein
MLRFLMMKYKTMLLCFDIDYPCRIIINYTREHVAVFYEIIECDIMVVFNFRRSCFYKRRKLYFH